MHCLSCVVDHVLIEHICYAKCSVGDCLNGACYYNVSDSGDFFCTACKDDSVPVINVTSNAQQCALDCSTYFMMCTHLFGVDTYTCVDG